MTFAEEPSRRFPPVKIVITGPVGAGKTSAITAVSDIPPVTTDELATDEVRDTKDRTTVAMDFGLIRLEGDQEVHLYGTPGQSRFDFMWEILGQGAAGLIILVDATMPAPGAVLRGFIEPFRDLIDRTALAVGISHADLVPGLDLEPYHEVLASEGVMGPVLSVDPRDGDDVALLVEALIATLDPELVE